MIPAADAERALDGAVEAARDELIDLTRTLVRIPSENTPPHGAEGPVQDAIESWLRTAGLETDRFTTGEAGIASHALFFPDRDHADRPVVVGRVKGSGGGRSLVLSGHCDTVPAGGGWTREPFGGAITDGRLYGRGAFDMKGGLAAALMATVVMKRSGLALPGDLLVESVPDEEFAGGHGTLAARLRGWNADAAVVPENSGMAIYHAHRGLWLVRLTVEGAGGVDFNPGDLDAPVEHMGRLIGWMAEYRDHRRRTAPRHAAYAGHPDPVPVLLTDLRAGDPGRPHVIAVPGSATLEIYLQLLPGETPEAIGRDFHAFLEARRAADPWFSRRAIRAEHPYRFMPGSAIPADHPLVALARASAGAVMGAPVPARAAPYPCDLYIFNEFFRTPGILLGPRGDGAHAPDEWVSLDDLTTVTKVLARLAYHWCHGER